MGKKKEPSTGRRIIIRDQEGKELVNLGAAEIGPSMAGDTKDDFLETMMKESPFGAYVLQREDALLTDLDPYLLSNMAQSLLRKDLPEDNSRNLVNQFRQLERNYGQAISDQVLKLLLILFYIGDLSLEDKDEFRKGKIPIFSTKARERMWGKRNPADWRSFHKKKDEREESRLLRHMEGIRNSPALKGIQDDEIETLLNKEKIAERMRGKQENAIRNRFPPDLTPGLDRPLKGFVCTVMNYLKRSKLAVSRISTARRVARLLNGAAILNLRTGEPFIEKDIYNLARGTDYILDLKALKARKRRRLSIHKSPRSKRD